MVKIQQKNTGSSESKSDQSTLFILYLACADNVTTNGIKIGAAFYSAIEFVFKKY